MMVGGGDGLGQRSGHGLRERGYREGGQAGRNGEGGALEEGTGNRPANRGGREETRNQRGRPGGPRKARRGKGKSVRTG